MSYQEQAESINHVLRSNFNLLEHTEEFDPEIRARAKTEIINAILRFGQVAKFRCRSNVAYDNFSKLCFDTIADLERAQVEDKEFQALQVRK